MTDAHVPRERSYSPMIAELRSASEAKHGWDSLLDLPAADDDFLAVRVDVTESRPLDFGDDEEYR